MPRRSTARADMITAARALIARHGATAVGMHDIIATSGAPRGSIYHHFPGGKDEIIVGVVEGAGRHAAEAIRAIAAQADDPQDAVRRVGRLFRFEPEAAGWELGCPIAAAASEGDSQCPAVRAAVHTAFDGCITAMAETLIATGLEDARAHTLAPAIIASLQGGVLLSRGTRSKAAFDAVVALLVAAVAPAPGSRG